MKNFMKLEFFYIQAGNFAVYFLLGSMVFLSYGLLAGLFVAPIDFQQKDAVRIMYVHVPCAILSITIYTIIGIMSAVYLVFKIKIADIIAQVSAPFGAAITMITLITGALWGKPMWGTWWVWDARLTSELILLFLYFGYIGLRDAISEQRVASMFSAILAVIGLIDIPIIHFSVEWWNTLHQGASISKFSRPDIDIAMLYPLLSVVVSLHMLYVALVCINARTEIMRRECGTKWIKALLFVRETANV